jgi:hypothetical protein
MATILSLQAQLAAVRNAYSAGAKEVSFEGRRVVYASAEELREAMASLENQINGLTGANSPGSFVVRSTKGW